MGTMDFNYGNNFWGEKHYGYNVLWDNYRRGEENIQEMQQFLKDKSSFEEESQRMMSKSAAKISSFISHNSPFTSGWALSKGTFELLAEIQTAFVRSLHELSKEVVRFHDEYSKQKKMMKMQDVADAANLMQTTTTCLQKAKETYFSRYHELEKLKKESSPHPKELSKCESKLLKAKEEYRQYVEKYERVRVEFEAKMEKACDKYQAHDVEHYTTLRQFLLTFATTQLESLGAAMQVCSQFRESVGALSVDEFLMRFVKFGSTGPDRPQPACFEDLDGMSSNISTSAGGASSLPSSCGSSAVVATDVPKPSLTANDLLTLDVSVHGSGSEQKSPTASESSANGLPVVNTSGASLPPAHPPFSASLGAGKKLSMWLPKRKKKYSQSSLPDTDEPTPTGFLKFRKGSNKSKKSINDGVPGVPDSNNSNCDATSTASSSNEEKINGSQGGLVVDDEGYTVRSDLPAPQAQAERTRWSSCSSSDDESENEMQTSKIRNLNIRPAEASITNASVDELRDAIGNITIGKSSTFDKDPWALCSSRSTPFSQSMGPTVGTRPLRAAYTGDEHLRKKFEESDFARSNVPLNFSASLSAAPMLGMARARPRSNTPTHTSLTSLAHPPLSNKVSGDDWGNSNNMMGRSESNASLGDSMLNLSTSTANLFQATIAEHRVPVAMALNEYSHVWFKGADTSQRSLRTFGTVMVSFAASTLPLLTNAQSDLQTLNFRLTDTQNIKAVLPNKQLLLPNSDSGDNVPSFRYSFNRAALADWLIAQHQLKPQSAFFNAEVLRYELQDSVCSEPPLFLTAYWKPEADHTDIRVDFRYNSDCCVQAALLNLNFSTIVNGGVHKVTSDPTANWNEETSTLSWSLTELSRHGQTDGSLKARLYLSAGPSNPAHTYVTFQCNESTISGASVCLDTSDTYHLSMLRRKVISGKYFCEAEVRT